MGTIFSGGCDNKLKATQLGTGFEVVIGSHAAPIQSVFWCEQIQCVITGSWDMTIKFWSMTQTEKLVASLDLPDRVYGMDVSGAMCVVALADRQLWVYDLSQLHTSSQPIRQGETALKMQTRCVSCFPDQTGYALGSIEGRCSISFLHNTRSNFAFKCHRVQDDIYAVNAISFHPVYGTFSTAGSDGNFVFWDKDNRHRLKQFNCVGAPINATGFNANGSLFAYAASYDWSRGYDGNTTTQSRIWIHKVEESEVKPKEKENASGRGAARR